MELSGESRTKYIVVGIVILLTIGAVGSYYLVIRPVEIEIEEGEAEETVAYLGEDEPNRNLDLSAPAETDVEGYGDLKFEVESKSMLKWPYSQEISLDLKAIGDFDEELDLESLKFTAVETEENEDLPNHINFMMSRSK
ncbi:MAG: hypothetical protein ACLFSM_09335, partial [Thermoplasmata archaeon]